MTARPPWLQHCEQPLSRQYDVALLDLDGVVYLGQDPVRGAAAHLRAAREQGMRLGFVTNNAARSAGAVAAHLTALGVPADADEIVTSAQTAAGVLADRLGPGASVLVVGADALADAVRDRGLSPVREASSQVVAVVQGYSPDTGWRELAEACRALRRGAWWVATNADVTVPSPDGPLPGNGAFVDVVRRTTGCDPMVTGKPEPAMHRECLERTGARHPLVVGDRLDTDIEGAGRVGCDSLLVLTGVTDVPQLLAAAAPHRPTYLAADLTGLLEPQPAPEPTPEGWTCAGWSVSVGHTATSPLVLTGAGTAMSAVRALCAAAWTGTGGRPEAGDSRAELVLAELGLAGTPSRDLTASCGA